MNTGNAAQVQPPKTEPTMPSDDTERPPLATVSSDPTPYYGNDLEVMQNLKNYQAWIMRWFGPYLCGKILEIGAGMGTFSTQLAPRADHLDALEPDATQFTSLKQKQTHHLPNSALFNCTSEAFFAEDARPNTYDAVFMVNVLEHIEDDEACIRQVYNALKPGGTFCVFVPALQQLYGPLDKILGHYRRYHRDPMHQQFTNAGFNVKTCRYFDLLGTLPWWLVNVKIGKTSAGRTLPIVYDRIGVPLTRLCEKLITPPTGKNVLLIAQKPE